jgi:hypothetical protein
VRLKTQLFPKIKTLALRMLRIQDAEDSALLRLSVPSSMVKMYILTPEDGTGR